MKSNVDEFHLKEILFKWMKLIDSHPKTIVGVSYSTFYIDPNSSLIIIRRKKKIFEKKTKEKKHDFSCKAQREQSQ